MPCALDPHAPHARVGMHASRESGVEQPREAEIVEVATAPALFRLLDAGGVDVMVFETREL